jgi:hypothetical protein
MKISRRVTAKIQALQLYSQRDGVTAEAVIGIDDEATEVN